jgi:gamma-glutamylcyclotransferase (GGCT)/AIG2-like uncharacterized protein YtfP
MNLPYFAYGSNMNLEQMAVRCPGAQMVSLVRKTGWRYIINQRGYVTALEDPDALTLGCLWKLSKEHWVALDRYEGVGEGFYRRVDCEVITLKSGELVQCIAYRAANETPGVPTENYVETVICGARQIGLPMDYLQFLESWRHGPPGT